MSNILDSTRMSLIVGLKTLNNKTLLDRIIGETEMLSFKRLVGKTIYEGILSEMNSDSGYSETLLGLLEGGIYNCIAYLAYANYILQGNVVATYSGAVQKTNPYSEGISSGQQKNLFVYYSDLASEYWNNVKEATETYFNINACNNDGGTRTDKFHQIIGLRKDYKGKKIEITQM